MAGRPYVLAETPLRVLERTRWDVAVLPWGATEAHNLHLPYGTDALEAARVAEEACRLAWERGARVIALPAVPFGVNTTQLDIPLTLSIDPTTQLAVLGDLVASLEHQGIHKLVILNGHGGNEFRWMVRELYPRHDVFVSVVEWWKVVDAGAWFDIPGDHAGELETSVMLHLAPELVLPLDQAGPGRARAAALEALRQGWAWTPRPWTRVTDDTGVGDPAAATAEKGRGFFDAAAAAIAGFLVELAAIEPDAIFGGDEAPAEAEPDGHEGHDHAV